MNKCDIQKQMKTISVTSEVRRERARQDDQWGEQNHPDGTNEMRGHLANLARQNADAAAHNGYLTWRHILQEEVFEAFAEADPEKLRTELIQVAAVACAWVEAIDRRNERAEQSE